MIQICTVAMYEIYLSLTLCNSICLKQKMMTGPPGVWSGGHSWHMQIWVSSASTEQLPRVKLWKETQMLPFITRTWHGNGHSKAACWVHLLRLTDIHTQSMNNPLSALLSTCCCSLRVFYAEHNRSALPSFCTFWISPMYWRLLQWS